MAGSRTRYSFGESHMVIDTGGYHMYTRQFAVSSGSATTILNRGDLGILQSTCKMRLKTNGDGEEIYVGGSGTVATGTGYLVGNTPEDFPITGSSPGLFAISSTSATVSVIYFLPVE